MSDSTIQYYEDNADRFFDGTVGVDMTSLYGPFLARVPQVADILDAGCGSGRDALAFSRMGHQVTAFDASPKLAALAATHLGKPVHVQRLEEITYLDEFDGVWACASLLHIPRGAIPVVMARMARALRPGGTLYLSFKEGDGERRRGGRLFTDFTEDGLRRVITQVAELGPPEIWRTADLRPRRVGEFWINALVERVG